jgi:hypothetical protein
VVGFFVDRPGVNPRRIPRFKPNQTKKGILEMGQEEKPKTTI